MSAIAYFVSAHGFGHAARASAVMAQLRRLRPQVELHVWTTVPRWFFDDSLGEPLVYHPLQTDVGLEQSHPLVEDLEATVGALERYWARLPATAAELAPVLKRCAVDLVVSDISPLGLAAAAAAGLPGVLVENFTWDWIYRGYLEREPRLEPFARRSAEVVARAELRIQTRPVCRRAAGAVEVAPVSREPRAGRAAVRRALGLEEEGGPPFVLMTMGGMGWRGAAGDATQPQALLVTLGGVDSTRRRPGLLALPDRSPIYSPDLVAAADLVVAKLGYSTVAECYHAGSRLAFLERPAFRESAVLAAFARRELQARALSAASLESGSWLAELAELLSGPRPARGRATGAREVAHRLVDFLG